jgi:4-hydroxybenzoate polyprenyltransferase
MTRVRRWVRYVNAMFPPAVLVPMGTAQFLSLYLGLQALTGIAPLHLGWRAVVGVATTVLWMLLIRLQDDITDAATDIRLGRAGDPRYESRPVVRGEITTHELRIMAAVTLGALVALNVQRRQSAMLLALIFGLGVTWLGFRWFFIAALARNPTPLAYLGRKALTILFGVYACAVYWDEFGPLRPTGPIVLLLLAPIASVAAWETARKIRIPEDETEYGTYSKQLGWRKAAWLPALFVAAAAACLAAVSAAAHLGSAWWYCAALGGAAALAIGACVRFRVSPTRARANLRRYVEIFGAVAYVGLVVTLAAVRGVAL